MKENRIAIIHRELCPKDKKRLVDFTEQCMRVCPVNRTDENCVTKEKDTNFPVIDENLCIGCGLCVKVSDKLGYRALTIVNLPKELQETPIHRFGINEFVLFRLPFPTLNETVGLIGPNGVGKTTALRILSGEIKPDLGQLETEVDFSNLIKIFRGTELQTYLEKMENKQIKTSIKPQRVDQIPSLYKGKVSKLLEKTDERKILNDLIQSFNLENILNNKINEISGGELQRTAIVACLAKDADIYYLDEPTSFLDVFQRLTIAKLIKKFCKDRSVMVVDHDLATLDFLADRIHVFYGVPGAYGIVSKPYSVRVGINTFLDGYIKEDNVRIRPEPINFFTSLVERKVSSEILVSFENIKKKLGKFKLEMKSGDIRQKEVLAVLGANALGKTTFAKILTGELKLDGGAISTEIKISYKPQYPQIDFDGTVREFLSQSINVESDAFKNEILRPLELDRFLEKNIQTLSGGELQRVIIANCLSKQADLYLLDEPSAFLDVEQRLAVVKLINKIAEVNEKSALVIDHDLLFLSQIGSRAMVFLGEPGARGFVEEISSIKKGFNTFLNQVGVTFRKDPQTGRPRANKLDSQLDKEQKEKVEFFYI
jgi:ATP-binding cassette subfamily E protein 1